jgi:hypothetical protein
MYGRNLSDAMSHQEAYKRASNVVRFASTSHDSTDKSPRGSMPFDVDRTRAILHVELGPARRTVKALLFGDFQSEFS